MNICEWWIINQGRDVCFIFVSSGWNYCSSTLAIRMWLNHNPITTRLIYVGIVRPAYAILSIHDTIVTYVINTLLACSHTRLILKLAMALWFPSPSESMCISLHISNPSLFRSSTPLSGWSPTHGRQYNYSDMTIHLDLLRFPLTRWQAFQFALHSISLSMPGKERKSHARDRCAICRQQIIQKWGYARINPTIKEKHTQLIHVTKQLMRAVTRQHRI